MKYQIQGVLYSVKCNAVFKCEQCSVCEQCSSVHSQRDSSWWIQMAWHMEDHLTWWWWVLRVSEMESRYGLNGFQATAICLPKYRYWLPWYKFNWILFAQIRIQFANIWNGMDIDWTVSRWQIFVCLDTDMVCINMDCIGFDCLEMEWTVSKK